MLDGPQPYRARSSSRAPYAAAWREYAWRVRFGSLLTAFWLLGLIAIAWRFRVWLVFVVVPLPLTGWCLRGFRCPRCDERFTVSNESGWWGAARVDRCVHCGLVRGAPADPDAYATSTHAN